MFLAHAFRQSRVTLRQSALIVIELHIVCQQAVELLQVAMVVSVKKLPVERGDCLFEFRLRLDFLKRGDSFLRPYGHACQGQNRHRRPSYRRPNCHHWLLVDPRVAAAGRLYAGLRAL